VTDQLVSHINDTQAKIDAIPDPDDNRPEVGIAIEGDDASDAEDDLSGTDNFGTYDN
jgi:hypothetical protein